jgi:hypothetical protein
MNGTQPIRGLLVVLAAIVGLAFVKSAEATVIVAHVDDNNPTTEGFTFHPTGTNITDYTVGAVNDGGTLAWNIDTTPGLVTAPNRAFYQNPYTAGEITALSDPLNQVIFTATFRVLADNLKSVNPGSGITAVVDFNTSQWLFQMGLNSANSLVIKPSGQSNIVLASGSAWHTIELRDLDADDVSGSAGLQRDFDVYVDNVLQLTNWAGVSIATSNRVFFGDSDFSTQNEETSVNWSLVKLETTPIPVPEPTSLSLLLFGISGLWRAARCRHGR